LVTRNHPFSIECDSKEAQQTMIEKAKTSKVCLLFSVVGFLSFYQLDQNPNKGNGMVQMSKLFAPK
jgi:hypothetical protein